MTLLFSNNNTNNTINSSNLQRGKRTNGMNNTLQHVSPRIVLPSPITEFTSDVIQISPFTQFVVNANTRVSANDNISSYDMIQVANSGRKCFSCDK
jgi:hypothetical protein